MALLRILLFILFALLNLISSTNGASDLIQHTCKNTQYYDLCMSSLQSDSSSNEVDARGLALIMINVAIANVTATSAYISSQMKSVTNNVVMKKAMKECADKYGFANDSLQNSVMDLNNELYEYVYMHVMAAADYPSGCRSAFKRCTGLVYPTQLAVREEGLQHICGVVLGIVDSLSL